MDSLVVRALRRLILMSLLVGIGATLLRAETSAFGTNQEVARAQRSGELAAVAPAPLGALPDLGVLGAAEPDVASTPAPSAAPAPAEAPAAPAPVVPSPVASPPVEQAPVAPAAAAAPAYALSLNPDGSVARWDPCRPITWRANVTLAPPGALDDLLDGFDDLAEATGMEFRFGGTTTAVPTSSWLDGSADDGVIVVAWAPSTASDLWTEIADGRGGWYAKGSSRDGSTWTWRIVRGFVLIDPAATAAYRGGFGSGLTTGALVLHELAHALGLSHVDDPSQLMYPTLDHETVAAYGDGDLAGLGLVGRDAGCIR